MDKKNKPTIIDKLKNEYMVAYGCISTTTITSDKKDKAFKNTKVYKDLQEKLEEERLGELNILIDIISPKNRKRENFENMIETFHNNHHENPSGVFVVTSISDLGTTHDEIIENFRLLEENDIGIYVIGHDEFSTVSELFEFNQHMTAEQIVENIKDTDIKSLYRKGRKKEQLEVTPKFKELYWCYENYFIEEKNTYCNHLVGKMTKVKFNQLCDLYESSKEYANEEEREESLNNISIKPKRHGAVPAYFDKLAELVDNGIPLRDACSKLDVPLMTEITYQRYSIKNRSSMGKATHAYRDELLNQLCIDYQNEKNHRQ